MLKGRTALVTGSTSGIGLGIAHALASEGANIVINGFGAPDVIKDVERELQAHGVRTLYHGADMSEPDQIQRMIKAAESTFGRVDILATTPAFNTRLPLNRFRPRAGTPLSPSISARRFIRRA